MRRIRVTPLVMSLAAAALAIGAAACGGDDETTTTTTAAGTGGCEPVDPPAPKDVKLKPPTDKVAPGEKITATVETNCGDFEFALDTQRAPKTAASFVHMVDEGVYDGTTFFRVVPNYVIQGGDPTGTGEGNAGYTITERPPGAAAYTRGTVAMGKTAVEPPGTSGSQFFVVAAADAGLPANYAILGRVAAGQGTIDAIEAQADPDLGSAGGQPLTPVVIDKITVG